jgi:endonuclease V-like protein UPF0215 family
MSHTKEPWVAIETEEYKNYPEMGKIHHISTADRTYIFICGLDEANAKRIVACVNACEGMKDPEIEILSLQHNEGEMNRIVKHWKKAEQQRDKLLEGLKKIERNCYDEAIVNFTKELIAECEDL